MAENYQSLPFSDSFQPLLFLDSSLFGVIRNMLILNNLADVFSSLQRAVLRTQTVFIAAVGFRGHVFDPSTFCFRPEKDKFYKILFVNCCRQIFELGKS